MIESNLGGRNLRLVCKSLILNALALSIPRAHPQFVRVQDGWTITSRCPISIIIGQLQFALSLLLWVIAARLLVDRAVRTKDEAKMNLDPLMRGRAGAASDVAMLPANAGIPQAVIFASTERGKRSLCLCRISSSLQRHS